MTKRLQHFAATCLYGMSVGVANVLTLAWFGIVYVALPAGAFFGAIYVFVRFVKWAWEG